MSDLSIINGISFDQVYNDMFPEIRSFINYPIGEIIPYTFKINNPSLKLLDKNNRLKKVEYPLLYEQIGDIYTEIYKHIGNRYYTIADDTEFMLPDMSGRYIVQGTKGVNYCFTTDDFQSFDLVLNGNFGKVNNISSVNNIFKSLNKSFPLNSVDNPIKSIVNTREHKVVNQSKSINIADKCVLFYMRVK